VLEVVDTAFDQMAFAIEPPLVVALEFGALMRGNHRLAATLLHLRDQICRCIPPIRDHPLDGEAIEQGPRLARAWVLSWRCPAVNRTRSGLPSPSTVRCILQLKPPRLRPRACAPCFFVRLPHTDAPAQSCCRSARVPRQDRRPRPPAAAPPRRPDTSGQTAYRRYSMAPTRPGATAIAPRCGSAILWRPQSGGMLARLGPYRPGGRYARNRESCSRRCR
jgi:hypothetical protein